ncbi:hypothetical protein [Thioclava electrotropha]|uniref:YiaAB two helix domain-containing protein n=1 Tax=Thioclava electrotropha TaxID=1549850 RepID=A0ABX6YQ82_9RHOB|nr:hypothetical protein [Thioclava electrotropha]QPZ89966.1 hypothetical protein AKL02_003035 [Thioclava electrotropha]
MITQDYKLARSILNFIAFVGWFGLLMGVALVFIAFAASDGEVIYSIYGGSVAIAGLGLVLAAQIASAQIDTAENTRKLVELLSAERGA